MIDLTTFLGLLIIGLMMFVLFLQGQFTLRTLKHSFPEYTWIDKHLVHWKWSNKYLFGGR